MLGEGRRECTLKLMKFKFRASHMHKPSWDAMDQILYLLFVLMFHKGNVLPQIVNALGSTNLSRKKSKRIDNAYHFPVAVCVAIRQLG